MDPTFSIAIGVAMGGVGLLIIGVAIWALVTHRRRRKSAPVAPLPGQKFQPSPADQQGFMQQPGAIIASNDAWASPPPKRKKLPEDGPDPPWEGDDPEMPPGILLSHSVPISFLQIVSNPRPGGAPPFERLLLISSRVVRPDLVAAAALPDVAVVVYDWKNFTLQELMRHVKKTLGGRTVWSVGVVAPGSKPGGVGLLEGLTTSTDKLGERSELTQFWRVLAGCVAPNPLSADGRRIDLLGCRVAESPAEGALLLRELYHLTTVPFTAADDALGGYVLSTFMEEPTTGAVMLISSTIPAIDMYFHRATLMGAAAAAAAAAGCGGPAPAGPAPSLCAQQQQPPAAAAADIFSRFQASVRAYGLTPEAVFDRFDANRSGELSQDEVLAMVQALVPGASVEDCQHVRAMLDVDGHIDSVSRPEFVSGVSANVAITNAVKAGNDDGDIMQRLRDYLKDHATLLRDVFVEHDPQGTGSLGHSEIQQLVACIPGLNPNEQKYIMAYLYQNADSQYGGRLTFDQLSYVITTPTPGQTPGQQNTASSNPQAPTRAPPSTPTVSAPSGPASAPPNSYSQPPNPAPVASQNPNAAPNPNSLQPPSSQTPPNNALLSPLTQASSSAPPAPSPAAAKLQPLTQPTLPPTGTTPPFPSDPWNNRAPLAPLSSSAAPTPSASPPPQTASQHPQQQQQQQQLLPLPPQQQQQPPSTVPPTNAPPAAAPALNSLQNSAAPTATPTSAGPTHAEDPTPQPPAERRCRQRLVQGG
ncbi:MAG: hypothetical protein WDW38_005153 [Sanguina aurantia]